MYRAMLKILLATSLTATLALGAPGTATASPQADPAAARTATSCDSAAAVQRQATSRVQKRVTHKRAIQANQRKVRKALKRATAAHRPAQVRASRKQAAVLHRRVVRVNRLLARDRHSLTVARQAYRACLALQAAGPGTDQEAVEGLLDALGLGPLLESLGLEGLLSSLGLGTLLGELGLNGVLERLGVAGLLDALGLGDLLDALGLGALLSP